MYLFTTDFSYAPVFCSRYQYNINLMTMMSVTTIISVMGSAENVSPESIYVGW